MSDLLYRKALQLCLSAHAGQKDAHGVDYAVKRVRGSSPPQYLIFFKGRDTDAIKEAFREYAGKDINKASRPSVLKKMAALGAKIKSPVRPKEKHREQVR